MALQRWFDRADELGAAGKYFEAHEELEAAWKETSGDEKIVLQGLIQIAAGLHRLRLHPEKTDGGLYLLERGLEKLGRRRDLVTAESLAALERALLPVIASGGAPEKMRFGLVAA